MSEKYDKYDQNDINAIELNKIKDRSTVLSMGCGGGREVKLLVKKECKVTGIDIDENMIKSSKQIEPNAEYICQDIVKFAEENKDKRKYDYIVGMYNFLSGIKREDQQELLYNLFKMLNPKGIIILNLKIIDNKMTFKEKLKVSIFFILGEKYGDIKLKDENGAYSHSYYFSKKQVRELMSKFDSELNGRMLYIKK